MLIMKNIIFPLAIVIAGIAIAGAIIYTESGKIGERGKIEGELSMEEINKLSVDFINNVLLDGQASISDVELSEEHGLYKINFLLFEEEIDVYVTRNGKLLLPEAINIEEMTKVYEEMNREDVQVEEPEENYLESENEEEEIEGSSGDVKNFVSCLKNNGFMIYGADWCPYCNDLVAMLGGKEIADSIYVECTEEPTICEEKEIAGYPTILINNEFYSGARSLEAFAQKTGCNI